MGQPKKELSEHVDKVPPLVQTLQFSVKEPTVGKAATFVKVDHVIQETKNLMNVISKVVNTCFECANKVSVGVVRDLNILFPLLDISVLLIYMILSLYHDLIPARPLFARTG